jgi:hypothetical protein
MSPERAAALVSRWARRYTRDLPASVVERRVDELHADLHDHIAHERSHGLDERRIARSVLWRAARGLPADLSWRDLELARHETAARSRQRASRAYRRGVAAAIGGVLVMIWLIGAVGIIGTEGDGADRLYLGVLAVGALGTALARFRAAGMARTLAAMAVAQGVVAAIALVAGLIPSYNPPLEVVALSAMFAAFHLGAAWLFHRAGRHRAGAAA